MPKKNHDPSAGANKADQSKHTDNTIKPKSGYFKNYCRECGFPFEVKTGQDYKNTCPTCFYKWRGRIEG
nr:hypothetical protein 2 [Gammaproteobacteria bacterium]